jgi:hypothetical protein
MYFEWPTRMLTKSEAGNCNWIISSVSTTLKHTYGITHTSSRIKPHGSQTVSHRAVRLTNAGCTATFVRRSLNCTRFCWRTRQSSVGERACDSREIPSFTRSTLNSQIGDIRWSVDLSASAKDFPSWWRVTKMNSIRTGTPGLSCPSKTLSAAPIRKDGPNSILGLPPGQVLGNPSNLKRWQSTNALKCWPSASWRT